MKTTSTSIIALLLSLCLLPGGPLTAQTFVQQSPNQLTNRMNDVGIQPNGRGVAIGGAGLVLTTTNYGNTWTQNAQPVQSTNRVVPLPNGGDGQQFLLLGNGTIRRSANGGNAWTMATLPSGIGNARLDRYAVPAANALYVGGDNYVLKSTDGGANWTDISPAADGTTWESVSFVDANNGWLGGNNGHVYRTTNGGQTWSVLTAVAFAERVHVTMVDAQTGFAAVRRDLYKTTDGGTTWVLWGADAFGSHQTQLVVLDADHLVSTQDGLVVFVSGDGGISWTRKTPTPYGGNYGHLTAFADGRVWVASDYGSIAFSDNYGLNYADQLPGFKYFLTSIDFSNTNTGWCVGSAGAVARTQNAGSTWTPVVTDITEGDPATAPYYFWVKAYDYNEAVVASFHGIRRTTDGGQTWQLTSAPAANSSFQAAHSQGNTLAVLTSNERVRISTNRGQTWTERVISNDFPYLTSIHFASEQVGFAGGGTTAGQLFKTTDGGTTWTELASPSPSRASDIWFLDEQEGWLIQEAFSDQIYHTTDGGASWTAITLPQTTFWRKAHVTSAGELDVMGGSSGLATGYRSTDGGQTWEQWLSSFNFTFQDYAYQDTPNGHDYWICGTAGWITRASFVQVGTDDVQRLPLTLGPNPTSGMLHLQLPNGAATATATVQCFDALGRLVYAGAAAPTLSLAHLPNGVYVVQLRQGGVVYVGRVVKV